MRARQYNFLIAIVFLLVCLLLTGFGQSELLQQPEKRAGGVDGRPTRAGMIEDGLPRQGESAANLIVQICDGQTSMEIAGVRPDEVLSPAKARDVARQMMVKYAEQQAKQASKWTKKDRLTWEREQQRTIEEGYRLFHDWKALGSTIGISCDMCHPAAADTHPETYPKFQPQLKDVSTLRDMINWCIEIPMKGKRLSSDDRKMIALESYITSQRKGVPLDPGKH
jgi:cytochrome c